MNHHPWEPVDEFDYLGKITAVIIMRDLRNSHISGALDVVATLRDRQIEARVTELARDDDLTIALRQSLRNGVDINDLSDASGLPVDQIRKRVERELYLGEDLATLAGVR